MVDHERIRPIGNWAYIKVLPRKDKTTGGLHLPESKEDRVGYCTARVLSLGPGNWCSKADKRVRSDAVKAGDTVWVRKYLTEINPTNLVGHSEYCFISQDDLIALTEENVDIEVRRI